MGIFSSLGGFFTGVSQHDAVDMSPIVNIDGALMVGDIDINGNFYGVTQNDHSVSDILSNDSFSNDVGIESAPFESNSSFATDDSSSSSSMSISSDDSFSSFGSDDSFGTDFSSCDSFSCSWDD